MKFFPKMCNLTPPPPPTIRHRRVISCHRKITKYLISRGYSINTKLSCFVQLYICFYNKNYGRKRDTRTILFFSFNTFCFPHNIEVKLDYPLQSGKLISGGGGGGSE